VLHFSHYNVAFGQVILTILRDSFITFSTQVPHIENFAWITKRVALIRRCMVVWIVSSWQRQVELRLLHRVPCRNVANTSYSLFRRDGFKIKDVFRSSLTFPSKLFISIINTAADTGMQKDASFVMEIHVEKKMCSRNIRHVKPNLQCALCFLFLAFALAFLPLCAQFYWHYELCFLSRISCLFRSSVNFYLGQQKRKQCAKRQTDKRQKQETESKEHIVD